MGAPKTGQGGNEAVSSELDWVSRIPDRRGKRVVFVAHCLLNENTRYLGGARQAGSVREIVEECLRREIGIVQLPCPEQHAWGGVYKRRLLRVYGSRTKFWYPLQRAILPFLLWYTRRVYRKLAIDVAKQIQDYCASGIDVMGVIGVDASPSCGVRQTLDMPQAVRGLAGLQRETVTEDQANAIVIKTAMPGRGLFIDLLQTELARRRITVQFAAYDLLAELGGRPSSVDALGLLNTNKNEDAR